MFFILNSSNKENFRWHTFARFRLPLYYAGKLPNFPKPIKNAYMLKIKELLKCSTSNDRKD
jgi:hypothetical protein